MRFDIVIYTANIEYRNLKDNNIITRSLTKYAFVKVAVKDSRVQYFFCVTDVFFHVSKKKEEKKSSLHPSLEAKYLPTTMQ